MKSADNSFDKHRDRAAIGPRLIPNGMLERTHPTLSVGAQCQLLSVLRSSFYYAPQGKTPMNFDLMLMVDNQFLETPFYGVRQMT